MHGTTTSFAPIFSKLTNKQGACRSPRAHETCIRGLGLHLNMRCWFSSASIWAGKSWPPWLLKFVGVNRKSINGIAGGYTASALDTIAHTRKAYLHLPTLSGPHHEARVCLALHKPFLFTPHHVHNAAGNCEQSKKKKRKILPLGTCLQAVTDAWQQCCTGGSTCGAPSASHQQHGPKCTAGASHVSAWTTGCSKPSSITRVRVVIKTAFTLWLGDYLQT